MEHVKWNMGNEGLTMNVESTNESEKCTLKMDG